MMLVGLNSGLTVANETAIDSRSPMKQRSLKERSRHLPNDDESHTTPLQLLCLTAENVTIDNLV